ncbi:MAG TPA: aminotransferase class I/II-fold pyridoxal phosphate-dependent enzyme, partial [Rhizobiales bacterium]|nr:aminotransferase class I/II-fold pyridoxal phosphate-dependent enzyme [Hyphomicrobiales bacterium]
IKPKLLIAGGSAYPREIDFPRMAEIAESVGAHFLVDMAHIAGLVAAKVHPSPVPHADFVTCTTTKTLRGPRGGLILSRSEELGKKLQSAIFPGVQGSLHSNVLAAKAVCLAEALQPDFQVYGQRVRANARRLAEVLTAGGIRIVSGGTDTHIVLLDLSDKGISGQDAEDALALAGITSNKNPIPFDAARPADWVGLRLGTSAATTRGFDLAEMTDVGNCIGGLINAASENKLADAVPHIKAKVADLTSRFPIYPSVA